MECVLALLSVLSCLFRRGTLEIEETDDRRRISSEGTVGVIAAAYLASRRPQIFLCGRELESRQISTKAPLGQSQGVGKDVPLL